MAREKFTYNTQTLRYEKVVEPLSQKLIRIAGIVCAALVTAFIFTILSHKYLPSPEVAQLKKTIEQQDRKYKEVSDQLDLMTSSLQSIQERDATAHRMIFGMEPINEGIWNAGIGGHEKYPELDASNSTETLINTLDKVEKLKWQLAVQSRSLDTILTKAQDKEEMLASIPSIKPVRSDKLARNIKLLSGFGMRLHPIHKVRKMHAGIDFTAPRGTPIQATGNGKVVKVERRRSGYGNNVTIDHGYGYKTLYAHMYKIDVVLGQKVTKGQKIGEVGSTGTSTGDHCHYEVIFKGKKVNPIHYCMDGLSPEEYQEMAEAAGKMNQSFD
ncbi:MAG: M23 family metallopeptidase [Bacteroidota bacterium]